MVDWAHVVTGGAACKNLGLRHALHLLSPFLFCPLRLSFLVVFL